MTFSSQCGKQGIKLECVCIESIGSGGNAPEEDPDYLLDCIQAKKQYFLKNNK